jgi:PAS domain S-box-containing protein
VENILDFFLLLLSQFAGGPGPAENNLVRFGLPAILWAILLYIAWSRQRTQDLPREKWLVWGFGLALVREFYMFGQMAYRLLGSGDVEANCEVVQPLEHGLAMAAMIVVAGAFLHYIFEDPKVARTFLLAGIGVTVFVIVLTMWAWPRQLAANPQIKFHQTWAAWLFHIPLSILMGAAAMLLWRKKGWLRNVVASALTLYLFSELLLLLNYATARAYNYVICPIGNSFHILAIPLLGYVYLREQSLEKKRADEALVAYRDHLEELVTARTSELTSVNVMLKQEVLDRTQAEQALAQITSRYELILESAGEGICGIDYQGNIIFANQAAARMLGYPTSELINHSSHAIWHHTTNGSPHRLEACPIYQSYSQGVQRYGDDEYFCRRDGKGFPVRYFSNPVQEQSKLAGAVLVFQDITERKRSEAEIAQRNASLATQNSVAATLSQSLEIDENLKVVLEMVRVELKMEIGLIFMVDPYTDKLILHLQSGLGSAGSFEIFTAAECACQKISHQALVSNKVQITDPKKHFPAPLMTCVDQVNIRSLISVPLASKGKAVGVMTLGALRPDVIPSHKLELLTAIGQQIGMAIENSCMYKDAEKWAGDLTRLHAASAYLMSSFDQDQINAEIVRQSAWLLKCQKAFITRLNKKIEQFEFTAGFGLNQNEKLYLQQQLHEWALLAELVNPGKTIAIRDATLDERLPDELCRNLSVRAALLVPIWSSEKPQEFLVLIDVQATRQWHVREIELVESLSNRAAVALMNASLHHQLEVAAALEERQRIAANMHDGLAQTLSLLGLRVDGLHELFDHDLYPEFDALTGEIREVVASASHEVRRSIASLQEAPRPPCSLQERLSELLDQLQTADGPILRFIPGTHLPLFLPPDQLEQVIPVVQEAILNARRHAMAQIVSIHLEKLDEKIGITIADDGCGFDLDMSHIYGDHFGLSIMPARMARIGGEFQIDTSPGSGTRVFLAWDPEFSQNWKLLASQQRVRV